MKGKNITAQHRPTSLARARARARARPPSPVKRSTNEQGCRMNRLKYTHTREKRPRARLTDLTPLLPPTTSSPDKNTDLNKHPLGTYTRTATQPTQSFIDHLAFATTTTAMTSRHRRTGTLPGTSFTAFSGEKDATKTDLQTRLFKTLNRRVTALPPHSKRRRFFHTA
ncbi:unnamed protein product [Ectocarpus sp. 8 AP-2014]